MGLKHKLSALLGGGLMLKLRRHLRLVWMGIVKAFRNTCTRLCLQPNHKKIHVLYVTSRFEMEMGQTVRYRVYNLRHALCGQASTRFELVESAYKDKTAVKWADIVVFMRVQWSQKTQALMELAAHSDTVAVFDIDDIIFLPEYAENYCVALGEKADAAKDYRVQFEKFQKTFEACRFCTASTPFIAQQMESHGKKAYVIHNGFNSRQLKIACRVVKTRGGSRYIGYLSGSKTHDRDFEQVVPALVKIMKKYENVRLRIVGYLDVAVLPRALSDKTDSVGFMPWTKLQKLCASNYINLAPLDIDNPFCHAKSELKYFESAIVGVPTVASATDTFKRCISDGQNGMLAADAEGFYKAIKTLLDDNNLYRTMSEKARSEALAHYSPKAISAEAMSAYRQIVHAGDSPC